MARARNIKPSFFTNEQLADNDPLGRLLFIGLWTIADYNGNLECKLRTIKVQLLPWDDCDIKKLMINLERSGLIRFYSDSKRLYVNITNFTKHQSPHKNERDKPSGIPEYTEEHTQLIDFNTLTINHDLSGSKRNRSHSTRADSLFLNPDSLLPDSGFLKPDCGTPVSVETSVPFSDGGLKPRPPNTKKSTKEKEPSLIKETWEAYSFAYERRHKARPVRNATVNGQLTQFVKRIGAAESPRVAEFYVYHNNQFYVQKMHSVGLLLADAEKLRTEWITNTRMTSTQARQADQTQAIGNVFTKLIAEAEENERI